MGNRVYIQKLWPRRQLRSVMCPDADTGKVPGRRFNIFQSEVPHRVGWASPAADPETGNIYALGGGATVIAFEPSGQTPWQRPIGEESPLPPVPHADHRRRSGDRQPAISNWGAAARYRPLRWINGLARSACHPRVGVLTTRTIPHRRREQQRPAPAYFRERRRRITPSSFRLANV